MHAAFDWLKRGLVMLVAVLLATSCSGYFLPDADVHPWEVIQVPVKSTLSDIAFTQDANHGWIVGSRNTLLETQDGGTTWQVRELALEDQPIRLLPLISLVMRDGLRASRRCCCTLGMGARLGKACP
jgi:photosystem II stability/assembly factor-like uncharacterized protein